jgi:hypothetical protein
MTSPPPTIDPTRHCPKCDYVLAGLPGTPERWDGTFVADVACPECGGTVPAGGRVLEGAIHPGGLKPVPGVFLAMLVVNILAIGFMGSFAVREMLRGGGPSGHSWLGPTIQFLSNGGIVVWLAWLAWRRSPMARRKARAAPAGCEVRWIVGPGGIEQVDRRNPFKPAVCTRIEASRLWRVTGEPVELPEIRRAASLLIAWNWKLDAHGRRIDIESRALSTLDGQGPAAFQTWSRADEVAREIERATGLPADDASRGLPWAPFADPRVHERGTKFLIFGGVAAVTLASFVLAPKQPIWVYFSVAGLGAIVLWLPALARMAATPQPTSTSPNWWRRGLVCRRPSVGKCSRQLARPGPDRGGPAATFRGRPRSDVFPGLADSTRSGVQIYPYRVETASNVTRST